jgi:hypothetical protein
MQDWPAVWLEEFEKIWRRRGIFGNWAQQCGNGGGTSPGKHRVPSQAPRLSGSLRVCVIQVQEQHVAIFPAIPLSQQPTAARCSKQALTQFGEVHTGCRQLALRVLQQGSWGHAQLSGARCGACTGLPWPWYGFVGR